MPGLALTRGSALLRLARVAAMCTRTNRSRPYNATCISPTLGFRGHAHGAERPATCAPLEQRGYGRGEMKRMGDMKLYSFEEVKDEIIALASMIRVFKALGVSSATLDLGKIGKVALW